MLKSGFKEGTSSCIVIGDVEEHELRAVLEYIYKGRLARDVANLKMMELADMYELADLAARCGASLGPLGASW